MVTKYCFGIFPPQNFDDSSWPGPITANICKKIQCWLGQSTSMTGIFDQDTAGSWSWQSSQPKCHWDRFSTMSRTAKKGPTSHWGTHCNICHRFCLTGCTFCLTCLLPISQTMTSWIVLIRFSMLWLSIRNRFKCLANADYLLVEY